MPKPQNFCGNYVSIEHNIVFNEKVSVLEYNIRTMMNYLSDKELEKVWKYMRELAGERVKLVSFVNEVKENKSAKNSSEANS